MPQQLYSARQVTGDLAPFVLRHEDREVASNNRWCYQPYEKPKMVVVDLKNLRHKLADFERITRGQSFRAFDLLNCGRSTLIMKRF